MFGDLDWLLNASRGFVSISWASCYTQWWLACGTFGFISYSAYVSVWQWLIPWAVVCSRSILLEPTVLYDIVSSERYCTIVCTLVKHATNTADSRDLRCLWLAVSHIRASTLRRSSSPSSICTHLISYIATSSPRICLSTLKVTWRSVKIQISSNILIYVRYVGAVGWTAGTSMHVVYW